MRCSVRPASRPRNRAESVSILSVANAAMAAMVFVPTAAAQSAPPTPEEVLELLSQELTVPPPPSPSEFFAAHPDATTRVIEFVRPDLDGDGIEDLIFPIPADGQGPPRVDVWSGWTLAPRYTIEEAGADGFGFITLGVPDLDGDGIDDLVVTAPLATTGAARAGSVFVYSGVDGAPLMRINGEREGGALGLSVASAGDTDGDGLNDLIIGEPSPDTGMPGRAFIFRGRARAGSVAILGTSDAAMTLSGQHADDLFGIGVAGSGDATGDGVPDLLVGAPRSDHGAPATMAKAGEALLYDGATGTLVSRFLGAGAQHHLGASLVLLPDRTGDGRAEVVVGAPGQARFEDVDLGRVVSDGRALLFTSDALNALAPGAVLTEGDAAEVILPVDPAQALFFGSSIRGGHDVDGDGVADLLIGSQVSAEIIDPLEVEGQPEERRFQAQDLMHVYSGATGLLLYSYDMKQGSGRDIRAPFVAPPAEPQALLGDVDQNELVEILDLALVMQSYGVIDPTIADTDVNADGVTDSTDVFLVLDQLDLDAVAYALATDGDCLDLNGIPLDPCDCLELLGDLDLNDTTDGCDDEPGDDPEPGPGPGPGPGDNCDDLPRETVAECEAYAACVADAAFDPDIDAIVDALNDTNDPGLRDALEGGRDVFFGTEGRFQGAKADAAAAQADARQMVAAHAASEATNAIAITGGAMAVTWLVGALTVISIPATAGASIIILAGAALVTAEVVEAGIGANSIANIQADAASNNAQIDAAAQGLPFNVPQVDTTGAINDAMAAVVSTGASLLAAVSEGNAGRADAWADIEAEQARIAEEKRLLAIALLKLEAEKQALEDSTKQQCVDELGLPQP